MTSFFDQIGNFVQKDVISPIEKDIGALAYGDIFGGAHQASGSDWLTGAADVATIAGLGLGVGALAGGFGDAATLGAGAAADAGGSAAPLSFAAPEASLGGGGTDLSGFLGGSPITTDTGLPFAGGVPDAGLTPNAYVAQNFGDFQGVGAPGLAQGETSGALAMQPVDASAGATSAITGDTGLFPGGGVPNAAAPDVGSAIQTSTVPSQAAAGGGSAPWYSGITNAITHPTLGGVAQAAGLGVAGAGLGAALLKSNTPPPGSDALKNVAGAATNVFQQQAATGAQLQSYLANGTLPAPMQAQVDQLVSAQKAKTIAAYGARGQNTNPAQNSALQQDLNAIDQQGLAMAVKMESDLFTNGQQALQNAYNGLGISSGAYTTLAQMDQKQADALSNAIVGFAGTAAGKTTINLGGTKTA